MRLDQLATVAATIFVATMALATFTGVTRMTELYLLIFVVSFTVGLIARILYHIWAEDDPWT